MKSKSKVSEEFEAVTDKFVVLLNTPPEKYFDTAINSTNLMLKKGKTGVYITASRPYRFITREMQKRSVDTKNLLFIDCISFMSGEHSAGTCTYIENPAALEEISMHIGSLLSEIESDEKFLIMDSISTLLIYNSPGSVKEFAMFLINKLRLEGVDGILLAIEKELPEDLEQILISMCDKSIIFDNLDTEPQI